MIPARQFQPRLELFSDLLQSKLPNFGGKTKHTFWRRCWANIGFEKNSPKCLIRRVETQESSPDIDRRNKHLLRQQL